MKIDEGIIKSLEGKLPDYLPFWKILVRVEKVKEQISSGGIVIADDPITTEYKKSGLCVGVIVKLGNFCGKRNGFKDSVEFKIGDRIQFCKYSGNPLEREVDGAFYRIIEDTDVQCIWRESK